MTDHNVPAHHIVLELRAELHLQAAVDEFFRAVFEKVPATSADGLPHLLQLVISELFTNVARHAYPADQPGTVRFDVSISASEVSLRVTDHGRSFDPDALEEPRPEDLLTGGYGLFIVKNQMDSFSYTSSDSGNVLLLTKHLPPSGA